MYNLFCIQLYIYTKNIIFICLLLINTLVFAQSNKEEIEPKDTLQSLIEDTLNSNNLSKNKKIKIQKTTTPNLNNETKNELKFYKDSTRNSPKQAALLSLAFPGLGQVYNKKYWKLPIVYAGIGGCIFWVYRQAKFTKQYNTYLVQKANNQTLPTNIARYSTSQLESIRNTHRRNVQLASFITAMVWGFSILDAAVDAHIKPFDISENLSMQIKPSILNSQSQNYYALKLNLNLK
jgi:TM2 domain-containing membrane protein YozV